jgi:hypothetical protein
MRYVQDPLAKRLLAGEFGPGDTILAAVDGSGDGAELGFRKKRTSQVAEVS